MKTIKKHGSDFVFDLWLYRRRGGSIHHRVPNRATKHLYPKLVSRLAVVDERFLSTYLTAHYCGGDKVCGEVSKPSSRRSDAYEDCVLESERSKSPCRGWKAATATHSGSDVDPYDKLQRHHEQLAARQRSADKYDHAKPQVHEGVYDNLNRDLLRFVVVGNSYDHVVSSGGQS